MTLETVIDRNMLEWAGIRKELKFVGQDDNSVFLEDEGKKLIVSKEKFYTDYYFENSKKDSERIEEGKKHFVEKLKLDKNFFDNRDRIKVIEKQDYSKENLIVKGKQIIYQGESRDVFNFISRCSDDEKKFLHKYYENQLFHVGKLIDYESERISETKMLSLDAKSHRKEHIKKLEFEKSEIERILNKIKPSKYNIDFTPERKKNSWWKKIAAASLAGLMFLNFSYREIGKSSCAANSLANDTVQAVVEEKIPEERIINQDDLVTLYKKKLDETIKKEKEKVEKVVIQNKTPQDKLKEIKKPVKLVTKNGVVISKSNTVKPELSLNTPKKLLFEYFCAPEECYFKLNHYSDFDGKEWRQSSVSIDDLVCGNEEYDKLIVIKGESPSFLEIKSDRIKHEDVNAKCNEKYLTPIDFAIPVNLEKKILKSTKSRSLRDIKINRRNLRIIKYEIKDFFKYEDNDEKLKLAYENSDDILDVFVNSGKGNCVMFNSYYVALMRSLGVGARIATGFRSHKRKVSTPGHAWAEVFLPGKGWVIQDATGYGEVRPEKTHSIKDSYKENLFEEYHNNIIELAKNRIRRIDEGKPIIIKPKDTRDQYYYEAFIEFEKEVIESIKNETDPKLKELKALSALISNIIYRPIKLKNEEKKNDFNKNLTEIYKILNENGFSQRTFDVLNSIVFNYDFEDIMKDEKYNAKFYKNYFRNVKQEILINDKNYLKKYKFNEKYLILNRMGEFLNVIPDEKWSNKDMKIANTIYREWNKLDDCHKERLTLTEYFKKYMMFSHLLNKLKPWFVNNILLTDYINYCKKTSDFDFNITQYLLYKDFKIENNYSKITNLLSDKKLKALFEKQLDSWNVLRLYGNGFRNIAGIDILQTKDFVKYHEEVFKSNKNNPVTIQYLKTVHQDIKLYDKYNKIFNTDKFLLKIKKLKKYSIPYDLKDY